ncbi:hypothetical protein [Marivirga arenosa]|uniref:Uncharacterized protein n=1 Tax=Marivirga arenosa TaxID=3059076 RepID=A0AA51ZV16_9BACT|nr:hypothetical protein [Marivirga sp. BKB1-2]WNB17037.1 hypothetical protein QYS47_32680 [Marivirga sp. BKB1-2]
MRTNILFVFCIVLFAGCTFKDKKRETINLDFEKLQYIKGSNVSEFTYLSKNLAILYLSYDCTVCITKIIEFNDKVSEMESVKAIVIGKGDQIMVKNLLHDQNVSIGVYAIKENETIQSISNYNLDVVTLLDKDYKLLSRTPFVEFINQ